MLCPFCKKENPPGNSISFLDELAKLDKISGNREKADILIKQGLDLHKNKNYEEAINLWYQAAKADPSWWKPYFNLACAEAQRGNIERSLEYLTIARSVDPSEQLIKIIKGDGDLNPIRNTKEYEKLINKAPVKKLIIGTWADSSYDMMKKLPRGFETYTPAEYNNIAFKADGDFIINETSSRTTGTYEINDKIVTYRLTTEESEKKVLDGKTIGGKKTLETKGAIKITYIDEDLLCIECEKSGALEKKCYSKNTE